jgi:hypothetical protein
MVATQQRSTEESGRPSSASHAAQPNTENSATVNASVPRLEETLSLTSPGLLTVRTTSLITSRLLSQTMGSGTMSSPHRRLRSYKHAVLFYLGTGNTMITRIALLPLSLLFARTVKPTHPQFSPLPLAFLARLAPRLSNNPAIATTTTTQRACRSLTFSVTPHSPCLHRSLSLLDSLPKRP